MTDDKALIERWTQYNEDYGDGHHNIDDIYSIAANAVARLEEIQQMGYAKENLHQIDLAGKDEVIRVLKEDVEFYKRYQTEVYANKKGIADDATNP